jgi:hypothetical protein
VRDEIASILRTAYGPQADEVVLRVYQGVLRVCAWIEAGDVGRAGIEAVKLGLPEISPPAMAKLSKIADLEKRNASWETEPRIPAGQPGGGQWTAGGAAAATVNVKPIGSASSDGPRDIPSPTRPAVHDARDAGSDASFVGDTSAAEPTPRKLLIPVSNVTTAEGIGLLGDIKLPKGIASLGRAGLLVFGASLLNDVGAGFAKQQISRAILRFGLDPDRPADVVAASAYVWSRYSLPLLTGAEARGPTLDSASAAVARVVLVSPRTFVAMLHGSTAASDLITLAAKSGLSDYLVESRARPRGVDPSLQTTSRTARAAIGLRPNDRMAAHHLVPADVWRQNIDLATLARKDGWNPDNPSNLIALPADRATQLAQEDELPVHSSSHRIYSADTQAFIEDERRSLPPNPTPMQAHGILDLTALINRGRLFSRRYHETLKVNR